MADDEGGDSPSRPLLENAQDNGIESFTPPATDAPSKYTKRREKTQELLLSKNKHYAILGLVALDVSCLLADIFIGLIACDTGRKNEPWVGETRDGLQHAGLVFSCLFLVELLLCAWSFGFEYFHSWFHVFDALVIIASFLIDVLTHGVLEEVASLVIVLRLWRFVKIVEELSVGASEQMEDLELRMEVLEKENSELKVELKGFKVTRGEGQEAS